MDLVQNLRIKIKKLSMDLVHDRGSMDQEHESGPWTRSKAGVHGPLVHVLSSPMNSCNQQDDHVHEHDCGHQYSTESKR